MNTIKRNIHIILSISMLCLYIVLIILFSHSHNPNSKNQKQIVEKNLFLEFKNTWLEVEKNNPNSCDIIENFKKELEKNSGIITHEYYLEYKIFDTESNTLLTEGIWQNTKDIENDTKPYKKEYILTPNIRLEFTISYLEPKTAIRPFYIILRYSLTSGFFMLIIIFLIFKWQKNRNKNQLKTDYMQGVTHEMKSILTTIILAGEYLKNNNGVKNEEEYKNIIINESKEMLKMVQQILNMAVMEKRELSINYELIDIQKFIEDIIQSYSVKINNYQGNIEFINQVSGTQFWADKLLLKLALSNIIDNSIKYSAFHPIIKISAQEEQGYYVIKISDNGIGIPKSQLNNIFKPAVRLKNAITKKPSGVGMGLYFVKQIIKIHKGKIKVNSELNKGSVFCVYIPKYE
jgi:signal transduction histidine kinase